NIFPGDGSRRHRIYDHPEMITTPQQLAALPTSAAHRSASVSSILSEFISLLQLPNVTGSVDDLRVNAEEIMRRFVARGAIMEVVELPGASPVVIGELRTSNPSATLGVYVHYDGQPIDPSAWTQPPFAAPITSGPW